MNKVHCAGRYDNFYNGNNHLGVEECWSLKTAKVVRKKRVPISQVPPWKQAPVKVPSCYKQAGYIFVGPNQEY